MLKPDKFTDLNRSVVYTVALLIKEFKENENNCSYSKLYKAVEEQIGEDVLYLFLPAIDFLFLLGKVDYDLKTDVLEMRI
jgi:hypothetical protein